MTVLSLRFCARAFSSCGKWGPLLIVVRGPLTIAASLVAEHRLQTLRLSNCGSRAQLLRGMWDPPRPGLEPVSPALAGRLSTTAPPGKPPIYILFTVVWLWGRIVEGRSASAVDYRAWILQKGRAWGFYEFRSPPPGCWSKMEEIGKERTPSQTRQMG